MSEGVDLVLSERVPTEAGATAVVTLNRPDARNALTGTLIVQLREALASADADDSVGAVVLTGADPAFCAGVDLRMLGSEGGWDDVNVPGVPTGFPWVPLSKPIIGAINGATVTGGLELALACDILIASDKARFADTHARVAMVPAWGLTGRLPAAVGWGFARRMSLSGNFVDAETALRVGLVTEVVGHAELLPSALALAADIGGNNQRAVRALLTSYREAQQHGLGPELDTEAAHSEAWMAAFDPSQVAAAREKVMDRGRKQMK
ncbi:enoyl-CoA hydratase [Williamsia soli]|uniref:enoyl-CoA hydratase n=1 Tax=Williamsia soli TaxID=364929 RepID=UPI001A9F4B7D|nr:enoyl-CoA hydratase [Williamsia soli]